MCINLSQKNTNEDSKYYENYVMSREFYCIW